MSLLEACGWAAAHALPAATAAVLLGLPVARWLDGGRSAAPRAAAERRCGDGRGRRILAWAVVLAPALMPALVIGYAYSGAALTLVQHPGWNQALYTGLIALRLMPVAALVLLLAPRPAVSAAGIHCAGLAGLTGGSAAAKQGRGGRGWGTLTWWVRGAGRNVVAAWAVVALLGFGEFEIASLMSVPTWTVWLFDAQAGGLRLERALMLAAVPAGCELAVLLPMAVVLLRGGRPAESEASPERNAAIGWGTRAGAWAAALVALAVVCVLPAVSVLGEALPALARVTISGSALTSLRASAALAAASGVGAFVAALGVVGLVRGARRIGRGAHGLLDQAAWVAAVAVCLPGLMGGLVVGLGLVWVFQNLLPALYDTAVAVIAGQVLTLLPLGVLLVALVLGARRGAALHVARRLRGADEPRVRAAGHGLVWRLHGRAGFWVAALLCVQAGLDLTVAAMLAPTGLVPATVRLYNQMHYGRSAALSVTVLLFVATLAAVVLAGRALAEGYQRTAARWG